MIKKYNWLVMLGVITVTTVGMADINTPMATPNNANSSPDPCLNNPNIYVKQSCEQARQATTQRTQGNAMSPGGAPATGTSQSQAAHSSMPAWQQALQHNTTNTPAGNPN